MEGPKYGRFDGEITTLLCGGTLVFDENGNVLSWFRKPGTQETTGNDWKLEMEQGEIRLHDLMNDIKKQVQKGRIGLVHDSELGVIGSRVPPIAPRKVNRALRLELAPHLRLAEEKSEQDLGERKWDVMWNVRPQRLCEPVDFLKIGHHGSHNATPWAKGRSLDYEVNQILNEILPLPVGTEKPSAKAIASTQRTQVYKPIPAAELLEELGKRVSNTRTYYQELSALDLDFEEKQPFEDYWEYEQVECLKKPQPWRTDLENMLSGVDYVDVEIEPGD